MPDSNQVALPWLFSNGFFPSGPERNPSPDIPVLAAGRWSFPKLRPLPFRFAEKEADGLLRFAQMKRR